MAPATASMDKVLLTPREAAHVLSVSRSKLYELMASGQVASVKVGGLRRVPRRAVESFVAGLLAGSQDACGAS